MISDHQWAGAGCEPPESASRLAVAALTLFAVGIPLDVTLATRFGGSSTVLGIPLVAAAAVQVVRSGRVRTASATLLLLTAFVAWCSVTILWAQDQVAFATRTRTNVQLLAFVWLAFQILWARRDLRTMLWGYLAGCTIAAMDSWRAYGAGRLTVAYGRYAAEAFDPNDMAVTLALGIPIAAYLALDGSTRRAYLALFYVPVALSAIALSGSRGGMLAAGVAIVAAAIWATARSRAALFWTLALLAVAISVVVSWVPEESWGRVLLIRQQIVSGSIGDRGAIWRAGLEVFADHPIAGVGVGNFPRAVAPALGIPIIAHSTSLSVATESGIIGLLLFGAAVGSIVWASRRHRRNDRAFVNALLLTWLVGTASLTWEYRKATWFVFLVGAALVALRPDRTEPKAP